MNIDRPWNFNRTRSCSISSTKIAKVMSNTMCDRTHEPVSAAYSDERTRKYLIRVRKIDSFGVEI